MRKAIRQDLPDVIVSFLDVPNIIAIIASLFPSRIPVVVSERKFRCWRSFHDNRQAVQRAYRFATSVVANSQSQSEFIHSHYPFLSSKVRVIRNCVDIERFAPRHDSMPREGSSIAVTASVSEIKNAKGLIRALDIARNQHGCDLTIDWYGNKLFHDGGPTEGSNYYLECDSLLRELRLQDAMRFLDPVDDVHNILGRYDAVCLPSFQEGISNSLCEALACGKPIIASNFGDNPSLVGTNDRGWLVDPHDSASIAEALVAFCRTSADDREAMQSRCRQFAVEALCPKRFSNEYERLLVNVSRK